MSNGTIAFRGSYQEALRAIGAWMDVRGFQNVSIIENNGELLIEASPSSLVSSRSPEQFRLDGDSIERLCHAARKDRGSALSGPIPAAAMSTRSA